MRSILVSAFLLQLMGARAELIPLAALPAPVDGKTHIVFKQTPQGQLATDVYLPANWTATGHRKAIILFFGGGFTQGTTAQFAPHARYFASRGMVAFTPDYRVRSRQGTTADKSIQDAKSAIRWVRANARRLGVDPKHVAVGGGSAGGTCAALAAWNTELEPAGEDRSVSSRPDVLVLFNPALGFGSARKNYPAEQVNALQPIISAWKLTRGGPPAILFFGTADPLMEMGRQFARESIALGNRVEFYTAEGQKHGFFNQRGRGAGVSPWYELTVWQADKFLQSLGYLEGPPTIQKPEGPAALKLELGK